MEPEAARRLVRLADTYYQPFLHGYDNAPMWKVEPRNLPYRDALADRASAGLAGAAQPGSWSESVAKYVVVDMFAKACAGTSTKDVIADAAGAAEADLQGGVSG